MNKKIIIVLFFILCTASTNASNKNNQNRCFLEKFVNPHGHDIEKRIYFGYGYILENKTTHKKIVACTNKHLPLYGVQAGINTQNGHKEIQYPNGDILLEQGNIVELMQPDNNNSNLTILQAAHKEPAQEFGAITLPTEFIHRTNFHAWIYDNSEQKN